MVFGLGTYLKTIICMVYIASVALRIHLKILSKEEKTSKQNPAWSKSEQLHCIEVFNNKNFGNKNQEKKPVRHSVWHMLCQVGLSIYQSKLLSVLNNLLEDYRPKLCTQATENKKTIKTQAL